MRLMNGDNMMAAASLLGTWAGDNGSAWGRWSSQQVRQSKR